MKVSKRDILVLLGAIGILAAVCSYYFLYTPNVEKTEALAQENRELQSRINDLSSKMQNKDTYIAETESMNAEMDAIFMRFPVDVREEDGIVLAINQELISPMEIESIGVSPLSVVVLPEADEQEEEYTYEIDQIEEYEDQEGIQDDPTTDANYGATGTDTSEMPSVLMERNVTFNYLVSYEGLKRSIRNIGIQDSRMSINNLVVSYDESSGLLKGTTVIDMYCIPGQQGKEYEEPPFASVLLGADNIFGSMETYVGGLGPIGDEAEGEETDENGEAE